MSGSTVLVIGATGRIGHHVVQGLVDRNVRVRVLSRDPAAAARLFGGSAELAKGSLDDPASLARATEGADKLYLASAVGERQVAQHANAITAAGQAGVGHIVRISTEAVGEEMTLARWHAETEQLMESSGLGYTHLRPCNFMANMLTFVPGIARRGEIRAPFGQHRLTLVDVVDIAAVAVTCLTEPGHDRAAYRITGEEWLSYDEIAATIGTEIARPVRYVPLSEEEGRRELAEQGMPPWLVDDLIRMYARLAEDRAPPLTDVVRSLTGRVPRRFAAFVHEHAAAFAGTGNAH